jgi:hypothetical protein
VTEEPAAAPPTVDLSPGGHYAMTPGPAGYDVRDDSGELALVVPDNGGGEVVGRNDRWWIAAERKRHGWEIAARVTQGDAPVAEATQRLRPRAYNVNLTLETPYRLTEDWLSTSWTLRTARSRLARLNMTPYTQWNRDGGEQASIDILDAATAVGNLTLLMAISLVTIGIEATIPGATRRF